MTEPVAPTPENLARAARILRAGGLVAFPTETVYGLGADATSDAAVARIFEAKGRPSFNPLISHAADMAMARRLAAFGPLAEALAAAFWPGPLTLVLPRAEASPVSLLATAGLDTLAVRIPAHEIARRLIGQTGRPLAAPSANPSGTVSPTTAAHVAEGLGDKVDMILDAGPCTAGIESTVVSLVGAAPRLLRPGAIAREEIEPLTGPLGAASDGADAAAHAAADATADAARPQAPGMLASHYAPRAALRLDATEIRPGEALLAFGPHVPAHDGPMRNLSPAGDLREAAANLFAMLRALDAETRGPIAVMPIPREGLGEAIADRLARAAAPREAL